MHNEIIMTKNKNDVEKMNIKNNSMNKHEKMVFISSTLQTFM